MGRIAKPHGLRGEVIVELVTDRTERLDPGSVLVVGDARTRTLEVLQSSAHLGRWIVAFRDVATREEADDLRGEALFAEPISDDEALWVHELIGSAVLDSKDGSALGTVLSVESNPASDLLVLEDGALIPVRFVVEHAPGRVVVDVPDGLLA